MKNNWIRQVLGTIVIALFIIAIILAIPGKKDKASKSDNKSGKSSVTLTITGTADKAMLTKLTKDLKDEKDEKDSDKAADKKDENKKEDLKEFENESAKNQHFDINQFDKTVVNIPYANTDNKSQQLDIIYPSVGKAPYKVIMQFHGGGWSSGDKQSSTIAAIQYASQQGYAVVNVNYRLSGEAKWPAQLYDAKAAVRFIRANADKYDLDATKIVVWGNSAGAQLAQMLAATNSKKEMEDFTMGNQDASSEVQGVVSWYGISDITDLTKDTAKSANQLMGFDVEKNKEKAKVASPIESVTKDFPPILLVHGTSDQAVSYEQSVKMAEKVNEKTGKDKAELKLIVGASHGDSEISAKESFADDLNFVDKIMYKDGVNPYRSTNYEDIKIISKEK